MAARRRLVVKSIPMHRTLLGKRKQRIASNASRLKRHDSDRIELNKFSRICYSPDRSHDGMAIPLQSWEQNHWTETSEGFYIIYIKKQIAPYD